MKTAGTVTILGIRGSFPATGGDFLKYGGNTSCFPVDMVGLFNFPLFFDPEAGICIYGEGYDGTDLQSRLEDILGRPYWPLGLTDFPASIRIQDLAPEMRLTLGGVSVSTLRGDHPGNSLHYRLEGENVCALSLLENRINVLAKTFFGRIFIRICYAISPTMVRWYGNYSWLHRLWQGGLDKIVAVLHAKGFDGAPYEDMNWYSFLSSNKNSCSLYSLISTFYV